MEYYIEFIIFQEFVVDFILLYITGSLLYKKIIVKRLIVASIIGVLYTIAVYCVDREFLNYFLVKFLVSILMLTISYAPRGILEYVKVILCFYIISILIMGIIILSYFIFNSRLTIILLFCAMFSVYMLFKILFYEIRNNKEDKDYFRDVTIYLNGNSVDIVGFIDTGNELIDAVSNKPVVIVDINYVNELFSDNTFNEIKRAYENGNDYLIDLMLKKLDNYKFRLLKYGTISSGDEYMIGIVPSKTIIKYKQKQLYIDCVIGIYPKALSNDNKFQALLYKKLLNWEGESVNANEYY